jgi:hypothetical protein
MFKDTPEEKALEQIQDLRKQEQGIKSLGEGAMELKKDELQNIENQIQDLKNQYPEDENIKQAYDPYADIEGQTAFLDPFTIGKGLFGIYKGAKPAAVIKGAVLDRLKKDAGKKITNKVLKKINSPKYGTTGKTKTGGGSSSGGSNTVSGRSGTKNFSVSGPDTSANPTGKSNRASQSRGYALHGAEGGLASFADGGPARQNFAMGKRAFLKMLGGVGAGIAGVKTGLFGLGKKTAVKEAVKQTAGSGAPPAYFFKLVNKIKKLGDDVTETGALAERQNVKQYKDYTLTEDTATGRIEVQKIKPNAEGSDNFGNGLTEEVYMGYSPGETVVVKGKGIKTKPEYEEGTAYLRNDGPNTGDVYEEVSGVTDDIFEEVGEAVPEVIRKGKADGGRIGYAKGKGVMTLLDLVKNKFGKKSITTADNISTPQKTLDRNMFKKADNRLNDKRQMNKDELEDFEMEIGDNIEAYDFDGTVGDAKRIIKDIKDYEAEMFAEYKSIGGSKRSGGPKDAMKEAIDNASPGYTGDLKYDASLLADDLAEKRFGKEFYDLDVYEQSSLYDEAYKALAENQRGFKQMQNLSKPTKTLESLKVNKSIDMSDPKIADEFTRFMKESDPKGFKDIEEKVILESFNPKGRKKNATGGLAGMLGE